MSAADFDRVLVSSLPVALRALASQVEPQNHPWLLGFSKNLSQHVLTLEDEVKELRGELSLCFLRLGKLEKASNEL